MKEAGKRHWTKRAVDDGAAITQEQMTASQRATQINGRDIHGDLAFNHHNQAPRISIHYHNGVPTIAISPNIFTSDQATPTLKSSQPENTRPISRHSDDGDPSLPENEESDQYHAITQTTTRASRFVESGLNPEKTYANRRSDSSFHSNDDTLLSHDGIGRRDPKGWPFLIQTMLRRRSLGIMVLAILIIVGVITGVIVSVKKHKHPAAYALSSTSILSPSNTSNSTGIGPPSSGPDPIATSASQIISNTTSSSSSVKMLSKSSTQKLPTSNTARTTSDQISSTLPTTANSASTCINNCKASSTPAPTAKLATTTKPSSKVSTATLTTTPKPTTSPQSCTIDEQCTVSGQACDYTASTCFFCTYATLGMRCSGFEANCCDPWKCLPGSDAFSTCVSR